ncbi:protein of unknown function [Vibrio tapetis subsp. tapetis]|uniref:Uncharacterized protein n=1 Tax=Vibrio tapetis subsp. tapetis TaxID=1671868 RepID=A0A2N8ZNB2_9VIBR|nr:protein of unknown function [Vibrio tapetis subsp. tapetis]
MSLQVCQSLNIHYVMLLQLLYSSFLKYAHTIFAIVIFILMPVARL